MVQTEVPVAEEHVTVSIFSVPDGRPSDSKFSPKVCSAQVMFPFCDTLAADKYLTRCISITPKEDRGQAEKLT